MRVLLSLLLLGCDVIRSTPVPHNDSRIEDDVASQTKDEGHSSLELTVETLKRSETPSRTTFYLPISPELSEKSQSQSDTFPKGNGRVNKNRQSLLKSPPQSKLSNKRNVLLSIQSQNGKRSTDQFHFSYGDHNEEIDHSRILNYILGDKRVNSIKRARISGPLVVGSNHNINTPPHVRVFFTENSVPNEHSHSYKERPRFDPEEPHSLFVLKLDGNTGSTQIAPVAVDTALNDIGVQTLEINQEQRELQNHLADEQVTLPDNLLKPTQDSSNIDLTTQHVVEIDLNNIEKLPLVQLETEINGGNVQETTEELLTTTTQSDLTGVSSIGEVHTEKENPPTITKEKANLSQPITADGQTAALTQPLIVDKQFKGGSNADVQELNIPSSFISEVVSKAAVQELNIPSSFISEVGSKAAVQELNIPNSFISEVGSKAAVQELNIPSSFISEVGSKAAVQELNISSSFISEVGSKAAVQELNIPSSFISDSQYSQFNNGPYIIILLS